METTNFNNIFDNEELERKSSYKEEEKGTSRGQDGLYRIDMDKVSPENKNRGYRATLRFLMNVTKNPELVRLYAGDKWTEDTEFAVGPSFYKKITHYINIQAESMKHVNGYYDCPTSINPYTQKPFISDNFGPIAKTYFTLDKSTNSVVKERAKLIDYSNKYFSYVLVVEDEQQPELVGKIMIFSYGKQIKNIIEAEQNGDFGKRCNVFSPDKGKDFILMAKNKAFKNEKTGKEIVAPDYTISRFNDNVTPMSILVTNAAGVSEFKKIPVDENGNMKQSAQGKVMEFLLNRDVVLEEFAAKAWTDEQQAKVSEAIDYLIGKTSAAISNRNVQVDAEIDDFSFDDASPNKPEPKQSEKKLAAADVNDDDFDKDFADFDDDDTF